jgi:polyisoprenoid-binding protein YceI
MSQRLALNGVRFAVLCIMTSSAVALVSRAQGVPVVVISKEGTSFKFNVKASIKIAGTFDKWDATLKFTSPDVTTGVLDKKIQADSVNCGGGVVEKTYERQRLFRCRAQPADHLPLHKDHADWPQYV